MLPNLNTTSWKRFVIGWLPQPCRAVRRICTQAPMQGNPAPMYDDGPAMPMWKGILYGLKAFAAEFKIPLILFGTSVAFMRFGAGPVWNVLFGGDAIKKIE